MNPTDTRSELERVRRELVALQQENAQLRLLHQGLEAQLQEALLELAEVKRQLYGARAERLSPEAEAELAEVVGELQEQALRDLPLAGEVLDDEAPLESGGPRPPRPQRHPLPAHLERVTVVLEPEEVPRCEHCRGTPARIGEEVSEELDYVPASVVVRRLVRPKYACSCGQGSVRIASLPPRLLPQSRLGTALAVHLLLSRFDDHVAYYTLERTFHERHGVSIPRQQMVQWIEHIAGLLQPLCLALFEGMLRGGYLQVDETPVKVLDPEVKGRCAQGYLWFYAVPGGDVFLDFQDTRGQRAPHARLKDYVGTIQTDAYEVYDALKKSIAGLIRIGCLAHARRRFYRALKDKDRHALPFIGPIRQLYAIEREAKELLPEQRHQLRQQKAPQLWSSLKDQALALQPSLLPKSSMGKAVSYFLNEYEALTGYLSDGRFEIDNNLVENSIRVPAVGRRRWLFIGHPDAGWRSAVIYSLIVSCRRRGINPQEYLSDVLRRLPTTTSNHLSELLPGRWKPPASAAT